MTCTLSFWNQHHKQFRIMQNMYTWGQYWNISPALKEEDRSHAMTMLWNYANWKNCMMNIQTWIASFNCCNDWLHISSQRLKNTIAVTCHRLHERTTRWYCFHNKCVQRSLSLKCSNELVFEEWLNHNRTYNHSTTRSYMCRRRRREHQRKRKHKPTETDHSEEFNQKQVKSIVKSKKGLFPVVHITTHTSVTTIYYDDIVSHRDFISHLQVICKSFASHSSLNKSFTSHCNASHLQVISKSFMSHLKVICM